MPMILLRMDLACWSCFRKKTLFLKMGFCLRGNCCGFHRHIAGIHLLVPVGENSSSRPSTPGMPKVFDLVPTAMTSLSYGREKLR